MKPRIILAQTTQPNGQSLELHEHDGKKYLHLHGQQLAGPATVAGERELSRIAHHPFRPARQPKVILLGLGTGGMVDAIAALFTQKKATFLVYEPNEDIVKWQHEFFPESAAVKDPRVKIVHQFSPSLFSKENGSVHLILAHADYCPVNEKERILIEDPKWISGMHNALQSGGMLGITGVRPVKGVYTKLRRRGFDTSEQFIDIVSNAKKPRRVPILLGRKGRPEM